MELEVALRMDRLEHTVTQAVSLFRATDPNPADAYRGLYVSDEHVDAMLRNGPAILSPAHDAIQPPGIESRTAHLMDSFGLDETDMAMLIAGVAPDLDPRFERLYGYLHDDLTRRRVSIGLALQLVGLSTTNADDRARLLPGSALVANRLVVIEDVDRPVLTRSVRVPDRVCQFLLGGDVPDEDLLELLIEPLPWPGDEPADLGRALIEGDHFVHIKDPLGAGGADLGAAAIGAAGMSALVVDLNRLGPDRAIDSECLVREARLRGTGLVVVGIDRATADVVRALTRTAPTLVLVGTNSWDPAISDAVPFTFTLEAPTLLARRSAWTRSLAAAGVMFDPSELDALRLGPRAVDRTVRAARVQAAVEEVDLGMRQISAGARMQNSPGLERLARRVQPNADWDDLIVKPVAAQGLRELTARVRHRSLVFDTWGLRRGGGRGEGITALFTGGSGTGKTLAAEVIGSDLGLDLYVIDLSTVVDKYIGETEKNLERVFSEAEGVSAILFFDEADALFGKRSEVSDARDRYANLEVSYLLQRMEQFDGLAILASNLRGNLDEAFLRRLSTVIDFAEPDPALRLQLWHRQLAPVPLADDVDLRSIADEFELTGGNIRSAAVTAAVSAADAGRSVAMADVEAAVRHEYRKLGRLMSRPEGAAHGRR